MDIMLAEVKAFTCSSSAESWSSTIKYQVRELGCHMHSTVLLADQLYSIGIQSLHAWLLYNGCLGESIILSFYLKVIYKNIGGDNAIVLMCTNVDEVAEKISSDDAEHCSILVPKER